MPSPTLTTLQEKCQNIIDGGADAFRWVWDEQYDSVLSTLKGAGTAVARPLMEQNFTTTWDFQSIETAPETTRRVAALLGGLSAGQALFITNPDADVIMVGLWWPWRDGDSVSVRIGLVAMDESLDQKEIDKALKGWFGW